MSISKRFSTPYRRRAADRKQVLRSTPSGKRVSELSWASRQKLYSLKVWDEVGPDARQTYNSAWLLRLAEQIR
ncbi:hypothetical protein HA052_18315 [Chromobacterium haemolyticum]|uniref:Transposase n=1 Tax=Chromobacterium fluminis TaxID=3044269 RepID=A0ABX0L640_9NEIS|nr:hypothetical protein [Chromobacterium haemolyticum]NHR07150.1 hypothetical protein [Chromobacterium haemolyticum]